MQRQGIQLVVGVAVAATLSSLGGCSGGRGANGSVASTPAEAADAPLHNEAGRAAAAPLGDAAVTPEGPPIGTFSADLDGDGEDEEIVVHKNLVRIGGRVAAYQRYTDGLDAAIIDIDGQDGRRELAVIDHGIEDDGSYFIFPYVDGRIVKPVRQLFLGGGHGGPVPGNGTLTEEFGNCGEHTTVVWKLTDGELVKVGNWRTGVYDDAKCAACPFVDVRTAAGTVRVGEILRNLNDASLEALQSLALPRAAVVDGRVHVVIAERKPEVTQLDELYLTVDGVRYAPAACEGERGSGAGGGGDAAWCEGDRQRATIAWGDTVHVEFEVGELADDAELLLWGRGYYDPIRM